jgi:cytochrome c
MAGLELNKAVAAVLTAGIAFSMAGFLSTLVVHPERPHHSAIQIGEPAASQATAAPAAAAPALEPIAPLLASADAAAGQALAGRLCAACHSFNEGGRNGVGPNLHGVVGAPHARVAGFNYSAANRALADKPWGYEELNAFLHNPGRAMPGTRMAFAGIANAEQRANIIAYLRSVSPNAPAP